MLISTGGTVIKMPVEDVKRLGRSTQGVIVMRLREGEIVSTLAPVIESDDDDQEGALAYDGAVPDRDRLPTTRTEVDEPDDDPSEETPSRRGGRRRGELARDLP